MTPTYDVVPGDRVGLFELGDTLWHILELLREGKTAYPKVEVTWDDSKSHDSPILLTIPHLTLHFAADSQSITTITLTDLATTRLGLTLTYDTHLLVSSSQKLTRGLVGKVLGPTYDSKGAKGELVYPGVAFSVAGKSAGGRDEVVDKVVVSTKNGETVVPDGLLSCVILPGKGVTLSFFPDAPVEIIIGETTAQDLLLDLGAPLRRYWKEDERLEKMWGGSAARDPVGEASGGEYFMNYFQYGLDFLISPHGLVEKVVAHSNIPGSALFQRYAKCAWSISTSSGPITSKSPLSAVTTAFSPSAMQTALPTITPSSPPSAPTESLAVPVPSAGAGKKAKRRSVSANSDKTPEVVVEASKAPSGASIDVEGMTLDRVGEGGLEEVTVEMKSRLVGYEGLVVEEDLASGGISSVLVYRAM